MIWVAKLLRAKAEMMPRPEMVVKMVPRTEMVMKLTMVFSASSP